MQRDERKLTKQNGLSDPLLPDVGGWGGRYKKIFDPEAEHYHDACDTVICPADGSTQRSAAASLWRWRDAVQNDFANRIQCVFRLPVAVSVLKDRWTVEEDLSKLWSPPIVVVAGDYSQDFIYRKVKPSEIVEFDASASYSPNGGELTFKWFQYKEIDSVMPIVRSLAALAWPWRADRALESRPSLQS